MKPAGETNGWVEQLFTLGRSNSMELQNDPRFFQGNVIDKRLAALKNLTIVSSLMLGTALSQCFGLKKKFNLTGDWICVGVSVIQIFSFFVLMRVVFVCFMSLYTFCQQLYHIYRLMTSGPTGVELAGEYYLHPNIVLWRHTAVNRLLKSFRYFITALGFIIFVKIMQDGGTINECYASHSGGGSKEVNLADIAVLVTSIMNNVTMTTPAPSKPKMHDHPLFWFQPLFGVVVLCLFIGCAYVLHHINETHTRVFDFVYGKVQDLLPTTRGWSQSSYIENHQLNRDPEEPNTSSAIC